MVFGRLKEEWSSVAKGAVSCEEEIWTRVVQELPLRKRAFEKGEVVAPRIGAVDWEAVSNAAFVTVPDWPEKEAWKFLQALYFGTYLGDETSNGVSPHPMGSVLTASHRDPKWSCVQAHSVGHANEKSDREAAAANDLPRVTGISAFPFKPRFDRKLAALSRGAAILLTSWISLLAGIPVARCDDVFAVRRIYHGESEVVAAYICGNLKVVPERDAAGRITGYQWDNVG